MGSRQFIKNDSDLIGLLREQTVRIIERNYASEGGIATNNTMGALKTQADEMYSSLTTISGEMDRLSIALDGTRAAAEGAAASVEQMRGTLEATATGLTQVNEYAQTLGNETMEFQKSVEGMIRLGFINDPSIGEIVYGIAVGVNVNFTANVVEDGDKKYYEIQSGQTFGLYTSEGWQFWINGVKRGWFDSKDGMLHTIEEFIEDELQMSDWKISSKGGYGIKYIG